jgi:hypothetical protein
LLGKTEGKSTVGKYNVYWRILLKQMIKKLHGTVGTGLFSFRAGTSGGALVDTAMSTKYGTFLE